MAKAKKGYTKVLYVSVTPEANAWARKMGKRPGYSNSRYINELINKDMLTPKSLKSARLVNFG